MDLQSTLAAYYDTSYISYSSGDEGAMVWILVSSILAFVGGILIYCLFVKKKGTPQNKFLAWLKKFLAFDKMWIEDLLKIFYLIATLGLTLTSFVFISEGGYGLIVFLLMITVGNVALRVIYELFAIVIMLWRNTTDIKRAVAKDGSKTAKTTEK